MKRTDNDRNTVYYACKYTPVELLEGCGAVCRRLDPAPANFDCADACAHPNLCGFGKGILEAVHEAAHVNQVHASPAHARPVNANPANAGPMHANPADASPAHARPVNANPANANPMHANPANARPVKVNPVHEPTHEDPMQAGPVRALILTDCCDVMRRVYDVLQQEGLVDFLYFLPLPHKSGERDVQLFEQALRHLAKGWSEYSARPFRWQDAAEAWEESRRQAAAADVSGPHLSVSGAHAGDLLMRSITSRFDLPVTDDTCSGSRRLTPPLGPVYDEDSFFRSYAAGLLRQERPCMRMLDRHGSDFPEDAAGIVLHTVKFCDYYSFYYHDMRQHCAVPLLKIETDGTPQSSGQIATRLDAFAETLHVRRREEPAMKENIENIEFAAGVDSGSTSTDAVVMNADGEILGTAIVATGIGAARAAEEALTAALQQAGCRREDLDALVTTGYGRETTGLSDASVTEITCHARGAHFLDPQVRTVIDIGGQDSKVIRLDESGRVVNFVMNDKCAAGTGRFLDMMARALHMDLEEFSRRGLEWDRDLTISSMCTVFAESEVVSLVADNTPPQDIIHGLNKAVAGKTASLAHRLGGEPAYMMTGGVAQNKGVVAALEEKLGEPVRVPAQAQLCGAIGAALIALGK